MKVRLSQKQKKRLKKIYKSDKDNRASARAHMVILYYVEGYTMEEIAKICQCDRKTVSSAIKLAISNYYGATALRHSKT